jgi:hypothetical protein
MMQLAEPGENSRPSPMTGCSPVTHVVRHLYASSAWIMEVTLAESNVDRATVEQVLKLLENRVEAVATYGAGGCPTCVWASSSRRKAGPVIERRYPLSAEVRLGGGTATPNVRLRPRRSRSMITGRAASRAER